MADVGRRLNVAIEGDAELSQMIFTKRREKHSIGRESAIVHEDYLADVEYHVGANQGPPILRIRNLGQKKSERLQATRV